MSTPRNLFPASLGFAFVAVAFWQTFWIAVLCLIGAAVFHVVHGLATGTLSIGELQERVEAARSGFAQAVDPDTTDTRPSNRVS